MNDNELRTVITAILLKMNRYSDCHVNGHYVERLDHEYQIDDSPVVRFEVALDKCCACVPQQTEPWVAV